MKFFCNLAENGAVVDDGAVFDDNAVVAYGPLIDKGHSFRHGKARVLRNS